MSRDKKKASSLYVNAPKDKSMGGTYSTHDGTQICVDFCFKSPNGRNRIKDTGLRWDECKEKNIQGILVQNMNWLHRVPVNCTQWGVFCIQNHLLQAR